MLPAVLQEVAPNGATLCGGQEAAMRGMCDPSRIEGMVSAIFSHEMSVKAAEARGGDPLVEARAARDAHMLLVREAIDTCLSQTYHDAPCKDCGGTLPADLMGFVMAVGSDEPDPSCKTCAGTGVIRVANEDEESVKVRKRITYFKRVLGTTALCAKVRARTLDASDAYLALEAEHANLISMFGNETQTLMEGDDAAQGARLGIYDAAMRFDPTRPECANFGTVAYNWAYRNSRARKDTDKRPGVYAPSVDSFFRSEDGQTTVAVVDGVGPAGSTQVTKSPDSPVVLDLRSKLAELPDLQRTLMMLMLAGHTLSSAAAEMGLPRAKAAIIRDQAHSGLRTALSAYVEVVRD